MPDTETLNIELPSDLAEIVRDMVDSGAFASSDALFAEAVKNLVIEDEKEALKLAKIRQDIQEGIDSGNAGILDFQELRERALHKREQGA